MAHWHHQAEAGETGIVISDACKDVTPPDPTKQCEEVEVNSEEEKKDDNNNSHLIRQIGPLVFDSTPPDKKTRHRDVEVAMRGSILSRPGSPISWNFGVKESITVAPPRPESPSLLMWAHHTCSCTFHLL